MATPSGDSPAVSTPPKQEGSASNAAQPIFGSASTFGASTGFGGFTGVDTSKTFDSKPADGAQASKEDDGGEAETAEEEECAVQFTPVVQLAEVETSTGEEGEQVLLESKCRLYRFDDGEWKERGAGTVKLLEDEETKRRRLLMRQEKTLKVRANHIVMPGTKLQVHAGNEKARVWSAVDFAEETSKPEVFAIRFGSAEKASAFQKGFEEAMAHNDTVLKRDEDNAAAEETTVTANSKAAKEEEADLADQVKEKAAVKD